MNNKHGVAVKVQGKLSTHMNNLTTKAVFNQKGIDILLFFSLLHGNVCFAY